MSDEQAMIAHIRRQVARIRAATGDPGPRTLVMHRTPETTRLIVRLQASRSRWEERHGDGCACGCVEPVRVGRA